MSSVINFPKARKKDTEEVLHCVDREGNVLVLKTQDIRDVLSGDKTMTSLGEGPLRLLLAPMLVDLLHQWEHSLPVEP